MLKIRLSEERGHADHGWLDSRHTFSFADYQDPQFEGFRSLRVINEDRIDPGTGFDMHGHRDMEILSYVLEGGLEHHDSMGTGSVLRPGDVQIMSAGTGITHSEHNASARDRLHLLQIWLRPDQNGLKPRYGEKHFSTEEKRNHLRLVASKTGHDDSLVIHQDVEIYACILEPKMAVEHKLRPASGAWVQVIRGSLEVNGTVLKAGDGMSAEHEKKLAFLADAESEFLLFDIGKFQL